MRRFVIISAVAVGLGVLCASTAGATTPPPDPDENAVDNPSDENGDAGFDDWGLLGLLGLVGLAGRSRLNLRNGRERYQVPDRQRPLRTRPLLTRKINTRPEDDDDTPETRW